MSRPPLQTFVQDLCRQLAAGQDTLPDAALLERWVLQRDQAAFELLLRRHASVVLGVCRRVLRDSQDVEDAFQATFLLLIRKASSIRRRDCLAAWLHRVALRVALRARKARQRQAAGPLVEDVAGPEGDEAQWRDMRPVLDKEIDTLPERYRRPFILCHVQGKTNQEAADELGCPLGTILSRLHWARERLRSRLQRRGIGAPAAVPTLLAHDLAQAVAPSLVEGTCRAIVASAATSARAVALADGVLRAMLLTKIKWTAVVLLLVSVLSVSMWTWSDRAEAAPEPRKRPPANVPPATEEPAPAPRDFVVVPARVSGVLAFVAREPRQEEKPARNRLFEVTIDGKKKTLVRLKEGDRVERGDLLAMFDDLAARTSVEIHKAKIQAAEADLRASEATREETKVRYDRQRTLFELKGTGVEEVNAARLLWERYTQEVQSRLAAVTVARKELELAQAQLTLHHVRSPAAGIVQTILHKEGEAVRQFEPLFHIKIEEK